MHNFETLRKTHLWIHYVSSSISQCQFGFSPKHFSTHFLSFLSTIYNSLSTNSQADVIYLDFKKAFDSVPHNELLVKLWTFGIRGNLWKNGSNLTFPVGFSEFYGITLLLTLFLFSQVSHREVAWDISTQNFIQLAKPLCKHPKLFQDWSSQNFIHALCVDWSNGP